MINAKVKLQIMQHTEACYPNEALGVVMQKSRVQKFYPLDNISSDPTKHGEPDHQQYHDATHEDNGTMIAFVHSHPGDGATTLPSVHDVCMCNEFEVPFVITSWPEGDMRVIMPEHPPLIGRPWSLGSYDCWGLVMAFHALHGVRLNDYRQNHEWWRGESPENFYFDNWEREGFIATRKPPEFGDMIIMQIQSEVWNHAGIYVGDNQLLHHYSNRVSRRDIYSGWYQEKTVLVCRHKDLKDATIISKDY